MLMVTKLSRMLTYFDWLLPIKSQGSLSCGLAKITGQTKIIISPLLQSLWPPNLHVAELPLGALSICSQELESGGFARSHVNL